MERTGHPAARVSGRPIVSAAASSTPAAETSTTKPATSAGDMRVPVIVRTQIATGVSFPDANLIIFGANDISDDADITARPEPKQIQDRRFRLRLPRPHHRRLRRPRRARHRAISGPEGDRAGRPRRRIHDPRIRRAGQASTSRSPASTSSRNTAPPTPDPRRS